MQAAVFSKIEDVLIVIANVSFVLQIIYFQKLITLLRSNYQELWIHLGKPKGFLTGGSESRWLFFDIILGAPHWAPKHEDLLDKVREFHRYRNLCGGCFILVISFNVLESYLPRS
jgi:hypothetical protein